MNRKNLLIITFLLISACDQAKTDDIDSVSALEDTLPQTCNLDQNERLTKDRASTKNIILMIGDGMGLAQINAARLTALKTKQAFHLDKFPVTGLVTTHSANKLITDSAAAATALATGFKTNNRMIGQSPEGKH